MGRIENSWLWEVGGVNFGEAFPDEQDDEGTKGEAAKVE